MTAIRPLLAAFLLGLAAPIALRSQAPETAADAWARIPADGPCPSVVLESDARGPLVLGTFRLSADPPAVIDGDTIRVQGLKESLRLIGLDCEETFKDEGQRRLAAASFDEYVKTMTAGTSPLRPPKYATPMGEAAKRFAQAFFEGVAEVRLEHDALDRKIDYYGRHLVRVIAVKDGRAIDYNVEVVRQGLSPYFVKYGPSRSAHDAFVAAEKEARAAKRGIFGEPPPHRCYADYAARLSWWAERARDQLAVEAMAKADPTVLALGEDAAWEKLKTMEGKTATVAGVPSRLVRRGALGLLFLGHRQGSDFAIAGPIEKVEGLGLLKEEGNWVLVTGTVALYRGSPQFEVSTVSFRRVPVPAAGG